MTGNTKKTKRKTRETEITVLQPAQMLIPGDATSLINENKELGKLVEKIIISIKEGIFKNLDSEAQNRILTIIKEAQDQVALSEKISQKSKLTSLDIRELQLNNRDVKNVVAMFKAAHEQEELLAQLELIKRSKNFVEQQFGDRYSSICDDIDGKIILLNAELDKSKNQIKRLATTGKILDELQKQNKLIKNTLEKLDVQREILSLANKYLLLESQYQALNHAISEKLQVKEKHIKKGITSLAQEAWNNIEKVAANCEKENNKLQEKALPIEGRISILEKRTHLFKNALHSIDAELAFLKDIYPETLDMKAHADRKLLIIEIYGSLRDKVSNTNRLLETELSLEDKLTLQQHKDFLSKEIKKVESIMEVIAHSLNATNLNHKQYAEVASAVIAINEHKIRIEEHCDYIIDKAKLIKLDAEIAEKVSILDKLNTKYEETWGLLYGPLHTYAGHTPFAHSLKPILLNEGKRTFSFAAEQFQIKTPTSSLQVEHTSEEREQLVKEREVLKQKLDNSKTKINEINGKIQQAAKAEQQRLEPLRAELAKYISLAIVTSSFIEDDRIMALTRRYAKIHKALNFDFTNINSPDAASLLSTLLGCRLDEGNVLESQLAVNLKQDIQTLENIRETSLNKHPEISVKTGKFDYKGNAYPRISSESLPESVTKAINDYSTARKAIVLNDKLHPRIEDVHTLLANQTIINSFVNEQDLAYKNEQAAKDKIEKALQAKREQEEVQRKEIERIKQEIKSVESQLEKQLKVIDDKKEVITQMTTALEEHINEIFENSPTDERIKLLGAVKEQLKQDNKALDLLALKIKNEIATGTSIHSRISVDLLRNSLKQFHNENTALTNTLVEHIRNQFTPENLTKLTLSTSLLDQALQFIDKVIIPKLYKLVHKTEKPYSPGLFSSKTETDLFAFRETILPNVNTIVTEQEKAAPTA